MDTLSPCSGSSPHALILRGPGSAPPGSLGLSYIFLARVMWRWGRHPPGMAVSQPVLRLQAVSASLSKHAHSSLLNGSCFVITTVLEPCACVCVCACACVCVCVCVCVCTRAHTRTRACSVAESCTILCDPLDCSAPGSSVHGIIQERILEWVAISYSRGSSQFPTPGDLPNPGIKPTSLASPSLGGGLFTTALRRKLPQNLIKCLISDPGQLHANSTLSPGANAFKFVRPGSLFSFVNEYPHSLPPTAMSKRKPHVPVTSALGHAFSQDATTLTRLIKLAF